MANDQDMAGLPEDVREALSYLADAETALEGEGHNGTMYTTIRAELLRLDRECQDRMRQTLENGQRAERAEAELQRLTGENAELRADARHAHIRWSEFAQLSGAEQRKRIRAEAELAALKRRIAEAPTAKMARHECSGGQDAYHVALGHALDPAGNAEIAGLYGQRVALLPVGGEW